MEHYTINRSTGSSVHRHHVFLWQGPVEEWEGPPALVFEGTKEQCHDWIEKRSEYLVAVDNDTGDLHQVQKRAIGRDAFEIRYWHFRTDKATAASGLVTESVEPPKLPPNTTVLWESRPWAQEFLQKHPAKDAS